jgi:predicted transcriptional regulator
MPRIRQYSDRYAIEDFQREIRVQQAVCGMSQRELGEQSGIAPSTLCKRLKNPENFEVGELRKIIPVLQPDPGIVLALLGYSSKEIKRFKEETA